MAVLTTKSTFSDGKVAIILIEKNYLKKDIIDAIKIRPIIPTLVIILE